MEEDKRRVDLEPAGGGRAPAFGGVGASIHDRVREVMRDVYLSDATPAFLDAEAKRLLDEGRYYFRRFGMDEDYVLAWGRDTIVLPWCGDTVLNTLLMMLKGRGFVASMEPPAIVVEKAAPREVLSAVVAMAEAGPPDPYELAASIENKQVEKHHRFLGEDLLGADYASKSLDPQGVVRVLTRIC